MVSFVVDRLGRRKTQALEWLWLGGTGLITAGFFFGTEGSSRSLYHLGTFSDSFQYFIFVPVYLIPAEAFPTRVRATMSGFCSFLGKIGGIVGTTIFPQIWKLFGGRVENVSGVRGTMWFSAGLAFVGLTICIIFVPEYSRRSLIGEDSRYNELRRRYAARLALRMQITDEELASKKNNMVNVWRLITAAFRGKQAFHHSLRLYTIQLIQQCSLQDTCRCNKVSVLPVEKKVLP
ncbi:hypothetical protein Gasu2_49240 [Galdieria sulphuraria]|uniref:MFS transporter, PHS family, inorganic phosphate transporter n=1 Tax=Galdieria sulphuraria TaxID=130081 RepID=M2W4K1_GALSU|nr:MFS transporter, PHS family, inorganic phosphate transporter [Galdieria sulphuraria]EME30676.1 MFS transporter, PHS family, inorganic phosphate transporter [Galdieria sulphuraria]GJD10750.1 hypothetical protein Gasu2_49240 [Galdieria sulphuraria]|eukprot:XP_005707196.1 MFS transporter, PHS family, inorganic phosphate transporter [Galdieria sulphuraria]